MVRKCAGVQRKKLSLLSRERGRSGGSVGCSRPDRATLDCATFCSAWHIHERVNGNSQPPSIPDGISSPVTRTPWMSWDGCCPSRCQFTHQQDWHCCWRSGLSAGKKRFSWMQPSHVLARRGKRRGCSQAAVGHSSSQLKLSIIRHSSCMHVSCMETPGKVFPWQFSLLLLHLHKPSPWVCSWSYPKL